MTRLAGACADAAATLGRQGRVQQRWAIAVAMSDLIEPLCAAVTGLS